MRPPSPRVSGDATGGPPPSTLVLRRMDPRCVIRDSSCGRDTVAGRLVTTPGTGLAAARLDRVTPATPPFVPDFRERLRAGFAIGSWITLLDPTVPEVMAGAAVRPPRRRRRARPDAPPPTSSRWSIAAPRVAGRRSSTGSRPTSRSGSCTPSMRVPAASCIPQVRTLADVERAVAWCRYPPAGLRGIAPPASRRDYGRETRGLHGRGQRLVTCCIQIETREALDGPRRSCCPVPGIDTILRRTERPRRLARPHRPDRPRRSRGRDRARSSSGATGPRDPGRGLDPVAGASPDAAARPGLRAGSRSRRLRLLAAAADAPSGRCAAGLTDRHRAESTPQSSSTISCQCGMWVSKPRAWIFGSRAAWASGSPWTMKTVRGQPGSPGRLARREVAEPGEQLGLVGVGAEAADRADLAADLADLAVELDRRRAGLEVGAERADALVADEQDHRARVVDQVAQVADDPAAGQHPVRGDDHVRPRRLGDRLRLP